MELLPPKSPGGKEEPPPHELANEEEPKPNPPSGAPNAAAAEDDDDDKDDDEEDADDVIRVPLKAGVARLCGALRSPIEHSKLRQRREPASMSAAPKSPSDGKYAKLEPAGGDEEARGAARCCRSRLIAAGRPSRLQEKAVFPRDREVRVAPDGLSHVELKEEAPAKGGTLN